VIIKKESSMRNAMLQLCLVIIGVSSIHAVRLMQTSSFHLKVSPAGATARVVAVQGHDSLEMTHINGEYYLREIRPGHWQINVKPTLPYNSVQWQMTVKPGTDIDLGEIPLRKK
jgi:hypothetical protein